MARLLISYHLKTLMFLVEDIKITHKVLNKDKKGLILKNETQIFDLIKNSLNNNDYLMIKGSNSTGLNTLVKQIKIGKINAL